jgi:phage tail tape-measure protein
LALGASGYFEAVSYLVEDRRRADEYTAESKRVAVLQKAKDFGGYLSELQMVISFAPFDAMGRSRISQLINKSNQFNLTTRRYTEAQVAELEADPSTQTLQVSLRDRFGDSGMIAVLYCAAVRASGRTGARHRHLVDELPGSRPQGRGSDVARTGLGSARSLAAADRRPVHFPGRKTAKSTMRSLASKPVRSRRKARPARRHGCSMSRPIKCPNCR